MHKANRHAMSFLACCATTAVVAQDRLDKPLLIGGYEGDACGNGEVTGLTGGEECSARQFRHGRNIARS